MKRKIIAILMMFALAASLAACGQEEEITMTGMVVSIDGTVISLVEMDTGKMSGIASEEGERPKMPGDTEGFGRFNPDTFSGTLPDGEHFPQWGEGEMPEVPEGMEPPEGMTMPKDGRMPGFGGENGEMGSGIGNFGADMETTDVDIANAHISVEIDGGKASGSMDNIKAGSFVTITVNSKGEATYVLITSINSFGGGQPSLDNN